MPLSTKNGGVNQIPMREIIAQTLILCDYITDANIKLSDIAIIKKKAEQVRAMLMA